MTYAKVYLPREAQNYNAALNHVKRELASEWGGYTVYNGCTGGWVDDDGNLVEEPVDVVEVTLPSTTDGGELYSHLVDICRRVKDITSEDAILAYSGPSKDSDGETILVE